MTAITDTKIEGTAAEAVINVASTAALRPLLLAAAKDHAWAWLDQTARFAGGVLIALGALAAANWPGLSFLAAFSAMGALLYVANMADVERYRDGVLFLVPAIFVWVLLAWANTSPVAVGLTLFTHVFMAFFAAFANVTGTLRQLRLWSLLLGFSLTLLSYFVINLL